MIDSDKSGMMDFSEFLCILVVRVSTQLGRFMVSLAEFTSKLLLKLLPYLYGLLFLYEICDSGEKEMMRVTLLFPPACNSYS